MGKVIDLLMTHDDLLSDKMVIFHSKPLDNQRVQETGRHLPFPSLVLDTTIRVLILKCISTDFFWVNFTIKWTIRNFFCFFKLCFPTQKRDRLSFLRGFLSAEQRKNAEIWGRIKTIQNLLRHIWGECIFIYLCNTNCFGVN